MAAAKAVSTIFAIGVCEKLAGRVKGKGSCRGSPGYPPWGRFHTPSVPDTAPAAIPATPVHDSDRLNRTRNSTRIIAWSIATNRNVDVTRA